MRIPKISSSSFKTPDQSTTIEKFDVSSLERVKFEPDIDPENSKTFPKILKTIKAIARGSMEYKSLMAFLKQHKGFNQTVIFKGIKSTKEKNFSVEVHHSTFVMEDIVKIVLLKRMSKGESLMFGDIAEEIMRIHYEGKVDLVPLDRTSHALIHSENAPEFFFPIQFVPFGDSGEFYKEYKKFIPDNVKSAYHYLQDLSVKFEKFKDAIPNYMSPKKLLFEGFIRTEDFENLLDEIAPDK